MIQLSQNITNKEVDTKMTGKRASQITVQKRWTMHIMILTHLSSGFGDGGVGGLTSGGGTTTGGGEISGGGRGGPGMGASGKMTGRYSCTCVCILRVKVINSSVGGSMNRGGRRSVKCDNVVLTTSSMGLASRGSGDRAIL